MNIPKYQLYSQPSGGPVDWFINIEPLAKRCKERGWKIDLHSHPDFHQVIIVLQGSGSMMAERTVLEFDSPCALIIPVHTIHGFHYTFNTDGWVITLAKYCQRQMTNRMLQINQLLSHPSVVPLGVSDSSVDMICHRVVNIQKELVNKSQSYEVVIESDLMSILIELLRASTDANRPHVRQSDRQLKLLSAFRLLVEEHLFENRKVAEYANMLNVSTYQLRSACESIASQSPKEIIADRLLTEAKRDLIFSTRSIEQIAYRLGFVDPSYFTRFFKKVEGEAPSNFRQSFRSKSSEEASTSGP